MNPFLFKVCCVQNSGLAVIIVQNGQLGIINFMDFANCVFCTSMGISNRHKREQLCGQKRSDSLWVFLYAKLFIHEIHILYELYKH